MVCVFGEEVDACRKRHVVSSLQVSGWHGTGPGSRADRSSGPAQQSRLVRAEAGGLDTGSAWVLSGVEGGSVVSTA